MYQLRFPLKMETFVSVKYHNKWVYAGTNKKILQKLYIH